MLLIINNHLSDKTISFHQLAIANQIAFFDFFLISQTLYHLLTLEYFNFLKNYYIKKIDKLVRLGDEKFGKLEFLSGFQSFQNLTFKLTTI